MRYEKTVDGQTINHVWDGSQQIIADVIDNQFYEADCYIRGTNLVAKYNYRNGDKSEYTYYTQNAHGDVVNLTDKDGKVTKKYTYDAFGVEKNIDKNDTNAFRYCGEYYDAETDTIYLRARYYNPTTGRFISRDSFAGNLGDPLSLNLYTYCANNPVYYSDPTGHIAGVDDTILLGSIAFTAVSAAISALSQPKVQKAISDGINSICDSVVSGAKKSYNAYVSGLLAVGNFIGIRNSSVNFEMTGEVGRHFGDRACENPYLDKWKSFDITNSKTTTFDDADSIEKTITIPKMPDSPATYYHATTLENALNIQSTNIMRGSQWEGGYIYAWKRKPSKKVLNLSGAASTEVLISFQTYSAFAPDPAFSGNNTDLSLFERLKINTYMPVRSCFSGDIRVSNVQIIK